MSRKIKFFLRRILFSNMLKKYTFQVWCKYLCFFFSFRAYTKIWRYVSSIKPAQKALKVSFPYEVVYRGIVTGSVRKYGNFSCRLGHSAFKTANRLLIKMEITPVTETYKISCRHQSSDATATSARATELQQSETRFVWDFSSRVCVGIDINLWRLDKRLAPVAQPVAMPAL